MDATAARFPQRRRVEVAIVGDEVLGDSPFLRDRGFLAATSLRLVWVGSTGSSRRRWSSSRLRIRCAVVRTQV
jgi:hypothetical protein